jgi:AraC-like DNA-binding protein
MALARARLHDPPTLGEMAAAAGLSPGRLSALFRERTGLPPHAWCTRLRLARACALLGIPGLGVAEVGRRLGWEDPLYFSRVFRRVMGLSPREWRTRQSIGA